MLEQIIAAAEKKADYAEVRLLRTRSKRVTVRLGQRESMEDATKNELGIRIFKNHRSALASTTKLADWRACLDSLSGIISALPEDEWAKPPAEKHLGAYAGDLDMDDKAQTTVEELETLAKAMEDAARTVKGITNSEGSAVGCEREGLFLASTGGVPAHYFRSGWEAMVSVLAGGGGEMVRDYEWQRQTHKQLLDDLVKMGKTAAAAAVARLGATKPRSRGNVTVVFAPRAAAGLLRQLETLLDGQNAATATTLLKDELGRRIAASSVSLINDPTRHRGIASYPFDVEGVAARRVPLIERGVFKNWLLDNRCALKLNLPPLGHAAGKPPLQPRPKSANLHLAAGEHSPVELLADIKYGFYVTELLGLAFNRLSGDLSRGAAGFLIRDGELTQPVAEVTIAANIKDMLKRMTPASDLQFRYGSDSPTLRVEAMTLAGK